MVKKFQIPWASWYSPDEITLEFPDSWDVQFYGVKDFPEISDEKEIKKLLNNPHGTPNLLELAKGKSNAVIVVEDTTRHARPHKILRVMLNQLNEAGISDENITLISALGSHRPMVREDFIKKIGLDVLERINVENHHPFLNLVYLGESKLGTPIHVNKTYYEAELKITIGSVVPHPLAGFGGGAKIILPGVCGLETLKANHSASLKGIGVGLGHITDLRRDIEDVCSRVGLDFSINIVSTVSGDIAGIFPGHYINAHRKAIELFRKMYTTEIPHKIEYDVGFFNTYPEDTELLQSSKALNMFMQNSKMVASRGAVVMLTASTEGRGFHSLEGQTGAAHYINYGDLPIWAFLEKRTPCLYSPNVTKADVYHFYPKSIIFEKNFKVLVEKLEKLIGKENPSAFIFPTSIQLLKNEKSV
jgi:nickel-dependent lactate racemase